MAYLLDVEPIERSCKITIDMEGKKGLVPHAIKIERPKEKENENEIHAARGWEENLI